MKLARIRDPKTGETFRGKVVNGNSIETPDRTFSLSGVDILAPVKPAKVICVGLNYKDHIEETGSEAPDHPSLFFKPPTAITNPNEPIIITPENRYDPEGEVAVIIEKKCRNLNRDEAFDYIWGFTGLNDVTNRDAQKWEQNWVRAKGFDTAAPIGPFIATPDEIDLPISFQLEVNGEVRQASDTSNMIFDIPDLLEEISSFMTLEKGDVISTGTPMGISPIYKGDNVRLKIEGVGILENPVRH